MSDKHILSVVMLIQSYYPHVGGAERQIMALAPLLQKHDVEVTVLTRRYPGLSAYEMIDNVPVYRLPIPGPKPVKSLAFTFNALRLIRKLKPDVIHAHELLSPATTAVAATRWLGVPSVVKVLRGGELGDVEKLKNRFLGYRRLDAFRKHLAGLIVISGEIEKELLDLGYDESQLVRIPNGVDTERFAPGAKNEKKVLQEQFGLKSGPVVIFIGRLSAEKRVDQLIKLWPDILESHPNAQLVILGTGPEEDGLKLMQGESVKFYGAVEDVAPYLKAADLFVLPSSTEGLSNALLEAMSVGLPVIVTKVGGAPDLIVHAANGWLIPPDRPSELQAALLRLLSDDPLRTKLGRAARQKILSEYDIELISKKLFDLYKTVSQKGE